MKALTIVLPIVLLSGCVVHQMPARSTKAHVSTDHCENLKFSIDRSIRQQEQEDRLDQLMWLKD